MWVVRRMDGQSHVACLGSKRRVRLILTASLISNPSMSQHLQRRGGSYLPSRRVWSFPVASHAEVLSTLQSVQGVRVHVEPLAKCALAVLQVMSGWV